MPSRKDSLNRNETFGRLLSGAINSIATYEGKTAPIVEEGLGQLLNLSGKTIQRYKAGYLPPEDRTVEILAEAAVQRGYLGREWLGRFLHAARYPFAEKLLDRLCPIGPIRPRPPRVYHNLPAPTYSQFVMRAQAFADVIDGLQQRSAVVLIVGLGGNGKTSLAREVAARCLTGEGDVPRFDAAVWVSDKDRPGTTNLSVVLDEIARTLDYPGFTQFAHGEKLYEVGQLLKRQRVLVVIDNFETITDGALLTWLLRLPEPSKALITSREYSRAFRNSTIVVDLRGMTAAEAQEFIGRRLRMLRIEKLASDYTLLEPLITTTGGNPKALEMALGLVKYEHRPIQQVVDGLYAARGELFDDLFTRAWTPLDEAARRVLTAMTFFPDSVSDEVLTITADVHGFAFDHAVERLLDLALLDDLRADLITASRYTLHPLVRAFAGARLADQPGFEAEARERWAKYLESRVSKTPFSDLSVLEEHDLAARSFLDWAYRERRWKQFLHIYRLMDDSWSVRALFDTRFSYTSLAANAANFSGDMVLYSHALARMARIKSYWGETAEANNYYAQAQAVHEQLTDDHLRILTGPKLLGTRAVLLIREEQPQAALELLQNITPPNNVEAHWICSLLAICSYTLGHYDAARATFLDIITHEAKTIDESGDIFVASNHLAEIAIRESNLAAAEGYLAKSNTLAQQFPHRQQIASLKRITSKFHTARGDIPAARAELTEAIDLLERLGMRHELTEAREELTRLDSGAI